MIQLKKKKELRKQSEKSKKAPLRSSNLAPRVDSRSGRPGDKTSPSLLKNRSVQQPGKNRAAQANPDETQFIYIYTLINLRRSLW
jgi:protein tyrosine/serine phosphatase